MIEHRDYRLATLSRQVVADILAMQAAEHPVQARRSLELAVAGAEEFDRVRELWEDKRQREEE